MAKVVFGDGRQMSGSVGASTFMRDGRVRRRTNPQNTVSARKTEIQGILAQLSVQWKTLTDAQRDAWKNAVTRVNALGASITLSPHAAYIAVNAALQSCGESAVVVPPAFDGATMLALNSVTVETEGVGEDGTFGINMTNSSGASRKILVEATGPLSPGVSNFLNKLRQIGCYTKTNGTGSLSVVTGYKDVFGAEVLGESSQAKRFGLRVRDLNSGNPIFVGVLSTIATPVPA